MEGFKKKKKIKAQKRGRNVLGAKQKSFERRSLAEKTGAKAGSGKVRRKLLPK